MDGNTTPSVEELWALMQQRQQALEDKIERLEAQLQVQRSEKQALAGRLHELEAGTTPRRRVSRAGLIRAAAIGAAGVAGVEALRPQGVMAAGVDGDVGLGIANVTGTRNSNNAETDILAAAGMTGNYVFTANAYNSGANSRTINGLGGTASGGGTGVTGLGGPGINGSGDGNGVMGSSGGGTAGTGSGVIGTHGTPTLPNGAAAGVLGGSDTGAGVQGTGATTTTSLNQPPTTNGVGVYGTGAGSGNGVGVVGITADGTGTSVLGLTEGGTAVSAQATSGIGLKANSSSGGTAVSATSTGGVAMTAVSDTGYGVHAKGFPGFLAEGSVANGAIGRGGRFISDQAQIRLMPASSSTPPTSGAAQGDFFTASNGSLYYNTGSGPITGGWVQLA